MAISYVSQASAAATSLTMPSHQQYDLLLMVAAAETSVPVLPTGWSNIFNSSGVSMGIRVGFKVAASGAETSGTWTNARVLCCAVYRSSSGLVLPMAFSQTGTAASLTITYPTISDGRFVDPTWGVAFGVIESGDTNLDSAPTTFTNRSNVVDAVNNVEAAIHDTNGVITSTSTRTVVLTGTAGNNRGLVLEIAEFAYTSSGTGRQSLVNSQNLVRGFVI